MGGMKFSCIFTLGCRRLDKMTDPNVGEILRLLSAQYRRQTIRVLRNTPDGEVGFSELIDAIMQEAGATSDQRDRIGVQLHHNHLPKLREQGLIEYDRDEQLVRYRPDQQVETVMDGISAKQSVSVLEY